MMTRPENALDVIDLVRKAGLVGTATLDRFAAGVEADQTLERTYDTLISNGLLTRYQLDEVLAGRWQALWLGRYRIIDRVGRGGMSHVYLAEHAVLGKRVALKVLSVSLRADKTARRRFVREARAAAALDHPNIVQVYSVDIDHDPPYLVMEYVEGISLQAAVSGYGTFTGGEAASVGLEVARGLEAATVVGLVHRDIKPANLLIDRKGGVKILDLGIVRMAGEDTQPRTHGSDEILGTLDYLSPEQAVDSGSVDARADLYSLGATLYFLLAGHPPFPGSDIRHKLAAKQYSDPPPVHRLRPDVDADLSSVIQTLLARDPAGRYPSAASAAQALLPFARLSADFPARLFRPTHRSTLSECSDNANYPPAPTQRIRKPLPRPVDTPAPEHPRNATDVGPATVRLSKSLTDLVMTALPSDPQVEKPPAPVPAEATLPSLLPPRRARWDFLWLILAIMAVLGGIALLTRVLD
jgi:serine/threonine-protein kinase